ncbi:SMI1/KNR4 family protein [Aquihabitans sp. G128]|uniref:SMI1/KNR4 family protein n=1 Tax=Aquihabitans sp. G128 TaxID=2849779 RepID=UPI001C21C5AC|nr:SMI1/KNR4 family protein [Aquihabitans sp. G128]QXC60966.1 SMI1/KNR4 family protein [Aquihabitans sp. G128]
MTSGDLGQVRDRIDRMVAFGKTAAIFGFEGHHLHLRPPLPLEVLHQAEQAGGYRLPEPYRQFLIEIADGGAGPGYGLFPFGTSGDTAEDTRPWGPDVGDPARPFLHERLWNLSDAELTLPENLAEDDQDAWFEAHDRVYFDPILTDGSIPIAHMGCAMWVLLVVTGDRAGEVWLDERANAGGIRPIKANGFDDWYLAWVDEVERQVGASLTDRRRWPQSRRHES